MANPSKPSVDQREDMPLPPKTQDWLLELARTTIAQALDRGEATQPPAAVPADAQVERGCFVSLHTTDGELRGCIGTFEQTQPLWRAVQDMAIAAATRDPRFSPMTGEELANCVIEISALTPCRPAQPADIVVGRHGLSVEKGWRRGVLLPQVATEYGWDPETFLSQTCIKAHLPPDAWRDGSVRIETFSAEVFSEERRQQT